MAVQPGWVLVCTAVDAAGACTAESFQPALVPVLSQADVFALLSALAYLVAVAWGYKFISRHIRW